MEEKDVMTLKASDISALGDDDWGSDGCLGGREGLLLVGVVGYFGTKDAGWMGSEMYQQKDQNRSETFKGVRFDLILASSCFGI